MHLAHAWCGTERTGMDLGTPLGDAREPGSGLRERLEADQSCLGPAQTRIDSELPLVGADIDDGVEGVAPEGHVMLERGGDTLREGGPAGRGLQQRRVLAQAW